MNKLHLVIFVTFLMLTGCVRESVSLPPTNSNTNSTTINTTTVITPITPTVIREVVTPEESEKVEWTMPLDRALERVTKKEFGTKVSPNDSPVQPEIFSGYHTGVDFEIFPEEVDAVVSIQAVCSGKILQRRTVSGYGGIVVQNCQYNNQSVSVIYGHLDITSISAAIGTTLSVGQKLGNLGQGYSTQTDGERKHLHLSIHRGTTTSILGYVDSQSNLTNWIDPLTILKK